MSMSVCFDTLLCPRKVVGRRREEKKVRCHFLGSQRQMGNYTVGICRMSARDPAQFRHKDIERLADAVMQGIKLYKSLT